MESFSFISKLETADLARREPTKTSKELRKVLRFMEAAAKNKIKLPMKPAPCRKDAPRQELRRLALEAVARLDEEAPWFAGLFAAVFDECFAGLDDDGTVDGAKGAAFGCDGSRPKGLDAVLGLIDSCIEKCAVTDVRPGSYLALRGVVSRVKVFAVNGESIDALVPALLDIVARCAVASAECMDNLVTMSFFHESFQNDGIVTIRLDHALGKRMKVIVLTWLHGICVADPDSVYMMALSKPAKNLPKLRALMIALQAVDDQDEVVLAALRFLRSGGVIAAQDIRMEDGRADRVQLLLAPKHDVMACSLVMTREALLQHGCIPVATRVQDTIKLTCDV